MSDKEEKKPRSDARRKSDLKYKNTHFDRIAIMINKGDRDKWKEIARTRGTTLRQMIIKAVEDYEKNYPEVI